MTGEQDSPFEQLKKLGQACTILDTPAEALQNTVSFWQEFFDGIGNFSSELPVTHTDSLNKMFAWMVPDELSDRASESCAHELYEATKSCFHHADWVLIEPALVWDIVSKAEGNTDLGRVGISHTERGVKRTVYKRKNGEVRTAKKSNHKGNLEQQYALARALIDDGLCGELFKIHIDSGVKEPRQLDYILGLVDAKGKRQTGYRVTRTVPESISAVEPDNIQGIWLLTNPGYDGKLADIFNGHIDGTSFENLSKSGEMEAEYWKDLALADYIGVALNSGAAGTLDLSVHRENYLPWSSRDNLSKSSKAENGSAPGWYRKNAKKAFADSNEPSPLSLEKRTQLARIEFYPYRSGSGGDIPTLIDQYNKHHIFLPSQHIAIMFLASLLLQEVDELTRHRDLPLVFARNNEGWLRFIRRYIRKSDNKRLEKLEERYVEQAWTFAGSSGSLSFSNLRPPKHILDAAATKYKRKI